MQLGDPYLLRRDVLESALCGAVAVLNSGTARCKITELAVRCRALSWALWWVGLLLTICSLLLYKNQPIEADAIL